MTYLLFNKPQRLAQVNRQRRHKSTPSGVCVIHTAEGSGANNVANYILNRTSYGSYHRIIDASTTVKLAPWSAETFHCRYTNPHSVGISAATFAANWNSLYKQPGDPGHRIIDRMAIEAADFVRYMKKTHKTTVPVKRITRSDALNKKPGFLAHGDTDPGRRTDPGAQFDWTYFFARINHHLGNTPSTPSKPTPSKPAPTPTAIKLPKSHKDTAGIQAYVRALGYGSVRAYQQGQRYMPGLKVDNEWGPLTQKHCEWVATLQRALNKWKAVIKLGKTKVDGDYGPFATKCVDAVIASNFKGEYTKAVRSLYGRNARPINDKMPGKAFCAMLGIPTHPMVK